MQIYDGSAVILRDGMDVCGFKFSTMQELTDKVSAFMSGENVKVTVKLEYSNQEKVCGEGMM